ncbi:MAG TPA: protein kinase [Pyrinomonadaceae bacterium]|nr:protein kinase [Pyrinomonadaceae bacterium]
MEIPQGTRLGRYEIRSPLGAGGMGEVYLANDSNLHRFVALKVLRAEFTTNKDRLLRFKREAQAASSLNHPNIITIYEVGTQDEKHFIVGEFVDGESLANRLQRETIEFNEILRIGIQIASALEAAHSAHIMHRDIKPDNIMIRRDGLVKVLDFGLAKLSEGQSDDPILSNEMHATLPGLLLGTAKYMSPEQARGLPADTRTDIWSLGVVLYEMAASRLPFHGKTLGDLLAAILVHEPEPLKTCAPEVPEDFEKIIGRALQKEKEKRYQQVSELAADLRALQKRLDFEAELARISNSSGESPIVTYNGEANTLRRNVAAAVPPASKLTLVQKLHSAIPTASPKESATAHPENRIRSHWRAVAVTLVLVVSAAIFGSYFAYTRHINKTGIASLAVLPFANSSNDPAQEYLSDGISESLINRLSQLPGIKVIANSSSQRYKGKELDLEEVASALDVSGIMTGRILQRGDDILISVELIDGRDRTQIWGEQYKRKAADLVAVQAEISREIVEKLRLHLTMGQQQKITASSTVNPEAYELLLKGRYSRAKGSIDDRKKAAEYFSKAIDLDNSYAPAYADLSDIYRSLANSSVVDPKDYLPKAEATALKALELDQNLAEAHYALANLKSYGWQWESAEREYKRSIELAPNLALAHRWYAAYLRIVGRHEEAITEINLARNLDPLSPGVNATVGYIYSSAGRYDQAIQVLRKTVELDENYPYTQLFLGFTYAGKGQWREAIAAYEKATKLGLDTPSTKISLGTAYARAGDRKQAQEILKQLQSGEAYVSPAELAILYGNLGDLDQAFSELQKAYAVHDLQLQYLKVGPGFDPLRSDSRFETMLQKVGFK